MARLVAIYRKADVGAFEKHYFGTHIAPIEQPLGNLQLIEVRRAVQERRVPSTGVP